MAPFMSRHLDKVLAHAETELANAGRRSTSDLLAMYRKFLKIEEHRLKLRQKAGGGGRELARKRVDLLDVVLKHLFTTALEQVGISKQAPKIAIIAIGGYGRGELNPCSDVDIMFLHTASSKPGKDEAEAIEKILYLLWDVGFKVGYSVRSVSEAIRQANEDLMSKTALLESRLLTGEETLFTQFQERFMKQCVRGKEKEYINWRIRNQAERHAKYNDTIYLQEPNIKSGCGGLRDYHNLLWVAFFAERVRSTSEMVSLKLMNESERRMLERGYDFLLQIRTELHLLNKRSTDILTLYFQGQIANRLQYPQKNILRRSEAFMKDYYMHARNIYLTCQTIFDRMALPRVEEKPATVVPLHFLARKKKVEQFDGFCSENGLIHSAERDVFKAQPQRLIRLFQHAQQRGLTLSAELQQLIRRRLTLVNRTFQYSRAARETFEAILSRKGEVGRALRMMHEVDFLGAYIPEFGKLTCLVQHEFYHRYTADEHTLVCIEKLDQVIDTEDPKIKDYRLIFQKIEDPYILYLALLLHDTGKASNSRNHEDQSALNAQRVARRLQINPERRRQLILLVDHHTTMSFTAQRRDLDDPETVRQFAEIIKNQANLDALMLLTLADGKGTGDEDSWSDWKESLVWRLYRSTSRYLADGEAYTSEDEEIRRRLKEEAVARLAKDFAEEIDAHFQYMPDRYFRMFDGHQVRRHIRMFRTFLEKTFSNRAGALPTALRWIDHPERGHTELLLCTWDRRQLLARIAGSLALAELNILSADVFTRGDNLVLDIFRVCDTNLGVVSSDRDRRKVEKILAESLLRIDDDLTAKIRAQRDDDSFYLAPGVEFPTRITVTNEMHPHYTLIDLVAPDRLGLLHDLLCALGDLDITIQLSRIATQKGAAIDSFYVSDLRGGKVSEADLEMIQFRLTEAATGVKLDSVRK